MCWDGCQVPETFKWCAPFKDPHVNARAFTESSCAEITIRETCVGKLSLKHREKEWHVKLSGLCPSPREYHILDLNEYSTTQIKVKFFLVLVCAIERAFCTMLAEIKSIIFLVF